MALKNLMTKSFLQRTISGIILVIIALITIISGGLVLDVTLAMVSLIGLGEIYQIYQIRLTSGLGLTGVCATIIWYMMLYFGQDTHFDIVVIVMLAVALAIYVFTFPKTSTRQMMVTVFGFLYVSVMLSYIFQIRESVGGAYMVWLVFLCSWGSDTCAYLAGVTMGKHKMAPVLSPKKSVEGYFGGLIGATVLGFIYALICQNHLTHLSISPLFLVPFVCLLGSAISVIGDLAASAIKRKHGIKDYGTLIPGHGGILDRFDSVIFTAPMIWFLLMLVQAV